MDPATTALAMKALTLAGVLAACRGLVRPAGSPRSRAACAVLGAAGVGLMFGNAAIAAHPGAVLLDAGYAAAAAVAVVRGGRAPAASSPPGAAEGVR